MAALVPHTSEIQAIAAQWQLVSEELNKMLIELIQDNRDMELVYLFRSYLRPEYRILERYSLLYYVLTSKGKKSLDTVETLLQLGVPPHSFDQPGYCFESTAKAAPDLQLITESGFIVPELLELLSHYGFFEKRDCGQDLVIASTIGSREIFGFLLKVDKCIMALSFASRDIIVANLRKGIHDNNEQYRRLYQLEPVSSQTGSKILALAEEFLLLSTIFNNNLTAFNEHIQKNG